MVVCPEFKGMGCVRNKDCYILKFGDATLLSSPPQAIRCIKYSMRKLHDSYHRNYVCIIWKDWFAKYVTQPWINGNTVFTDHYAIILRHKGH